MAHCAFAKPSGVPIESKPP